MSTIIDVSELELLRINGEAPTNKEELKRFGMYEPIRTRFVFINLIPLILLCLVSFADLGEGVSNILTYLLYAHAGLFAVLSAILWFAVIATGIVKGEAAGKWVKLGGQLLTTQGLIYLGYNVVLELTTLGMFIYQGWFGVATIWVLMLSSLGVARYMSRQYARIALGGARTGVPLDKAMKILATEKS